MAGNKLKPKQTAKSGKIPRKAPSPGSIPTRNNRGSKAGRKPGKIGRP